MAIGLSPPAPPDDPREAAEAAGLIYVSDDSPGINRKRRGKSFSFLHPGGEAVSDHQTLLRIRSLVIPPAWEEVWICPSDRGHIQAVGRDARGRKQYRYHAKFRQIRDEAKYARMLQFVQALPRLRKRIDRDMRKPGLSRQKVLAAVVRLLETTLIRVGNEEYARENHHFGLTTIRDDHVKVRGSTVHFHFTGKSGVEHAIDISDPHIAEIVRECQELSADDLFAYVDENGATVDVTSNDVNDYLREITGQDFTAKDFRTWAGTVLAAQALKEFEKFDSKAQAKKNIVRAIESVAAKLGNTPAVCKKCYVHPAILDSYMDGELIETLRKRAARMERHLADLEPEEAAVLVLLQRRLAGRNQKASQKIARRAA